MPASISSATGIPGWISRPNSPPTLAGAAAGRDAAQGEHFVTAARRLLAWMSANKISAPTVTRREYPPFAASRWSRSAQQRRDARSARSEDTNHLFCSCRNLHARSPQRRGTCLLGSGGSSFQPVVRHPPLACVCFPHGSLHQLLIMPTASGANPWNMRACSPFHLK